MNLPPDYTRDLGFLAFKKAIGHPSALEFVFNLCARCQIGRTKELVIPDEHFADALGLPEGVDADAAKRALIKNGLIEEIPGRPSAYFVAVFVKNNANLIACWANGALGGRPQRKDVGSPKPQHPHAASTALPPDDDEDDTFFDTK